MQNSKVSRFGLVAAVVSVVGLVAGGVATYIVASMIGVGTAGAFALATKIVDAIIAGSSAAVIASLLLGGGLGVAVVGTIRWAIGFWGRAKAIA